MEPNLPREADAYIEVRDVRKHYVERRKKPRGRDRPKESPEHRVKVLDHVDLAIGEGEIVCILGPSGCGKTTLLRIIAGFDRDFSGRVAIGGQEVKGPSPHHIFVFQHGGLLEWMTVRENVGLGVRRMKDEAAREARVQEFIDMVELTGFENHHPHQLSGGMLRRAELARALAVNPDVLFMDEPFTGLDFLTHMRMREEVLNLHDYMRKTILIVTHDIDDALIMADRLVILSERPATVKMARRMDFARPRDYSRDPELYDLRSEISFMLGVHYAL